MKKKIFIITLIAFLYVIFAGTLIVGAGIFSLLILAKAPKVFIQKKSKY